MGGKLNLLLYLLTLFTGIVAGEWNIFSYITEKRGLGLGISLKNYCESWRVNVELNNIRGFDSVPGECVDYVGKYMTSTQYKSDVQRAAEEAAVFLANNFVIGGDGKDGWIFDVDDTLLSTVPYYKKHRFGRDVLGCKGAKANESSMARWMEEGHAPAVVHILDLYHHIRGRGLNIFLISSRLEHHRMATTNNLVKAGYHGWTKLILRCEGEVYGGIEDYKAEQRRNLITQGYHLWGIVGDQWSSLLGVPSARRTFKLPNPMYYDL